MKWLIRVVFVHIVSMQLLRTLSRYPGSGLRVRCLTYLCTLRQWLHIVRQLYKHQHSNTSLNPKMQANIDQLV